MERMLTHRRQRAHISVLELKQANTTLVHRNVQERQLELDNPLVGDPPPLHFNTRDERDIAVGVVGAGVRGGGSHAAAGYGCSRGTAVGLGIGVQIRVRVRGRGRGQVRIGGPNDLGKQEKRLRVH